MSPVAAVLRWVEEIVVGYGLCPFAAQPLRNGEVAFIDIKAADIPTVFEAAMTQVQRFLVQEPREEKEEVSEKKEDGEELVRPGARHELTGRPREDQEKGRRKKEDGSSVPRMSPERSGGPSEASRPAAPVTTLLVFSRALDDFHTFLDFVATLEDVLAETGADQLVQLAHFHPNYQFADLTFEDAANRTNRAPFPVVQLLRVAGVARAIEHYPDVEAIPERNIKRMREVFGRG